MDEMRDCIVITAYKDPQALETLIDVLSDKFYLYIHVDKKMWNKFSYLEKKYPALNIRSERCVSWGGYEHLEVILELLKDSLEREWRYVHVISGEDFPVCKLDEIKSYCMNDDKIYMSCKKPRDGRRWKYYWLYTYTSTNYKNKWVRLINLCIVGCQMLLPFANKKRIGEFSEIYEGFVWGTYPKYAIEYVISYFGAHEKFFDELKWCKIPEEICFQTILMNSVYKDKIVDNNLRYMKMKVNDWGPDYLSTDDIKEMDGNQFLFCRKVASNSETQKLLLSMVEG